MKRVHKTLFSFPMTSNHWLPTTLVENLSLLVSSSIGLLSFCVCLWRPVSPDSRSRGSKFYQNIFTVTPLFSLLEGYTPMLMWREEESLLAGALGNKSSYVFCHIIVIILFRNKNTLEMDFSNFIYSIF